MDDDDEEEEDDEVEDEDDEECEYNDDDDGEDDDDPDQHGDVPEDLDIEGHQLAHQPVVRQAQNPGDDTEEGRCQTGQEGDKQRVENADNRRARVCRLTVIFDQRLVDVIARRRAQKIIGDVQASGGKVG